MIVERADRVLLQLVQDGLTEHMRTGETPIRSCRVEGEQVFFSAWHNGRLRLFALKLCEVL